MEETVTVMTAAAVMMTIRKIFLTEAEKEMMMAAMKKMAIKKSQRRIFVSTATKDLLCLKKKYS